MGSNGGYLLLVVFLQLDPFSVFARHGTVHAWRKTYNRSLLAREVYNFVI